MKLKIVKDNNPIMRKRSELVSLPLSSENKELLDEMLLYLKRSQDEEYAKKHNIRPGVGMAAIQVGHLKRMFVIYYPKNETEYVMYQLVNPKIIEESVRKCALEAGEGCLSVDEDHQGLVHRHYKIVMKAFDALQDKEIVITAKGYDAIVLQHEYDHLEGMFYYDRIDKNAPDKPQNNEEII
jgi:peptide deformylase